MTRVSPPYRLLTPLLMIHKWSLRGHLLHASVIHDPDTLEECLHQQAFCASHSSHFLKARLQKVRINGC